MISEVVDEENYQGLMKKRNLIVLVSSGCFLIILALFWLFFSPIVKGKSSDSFPLKICKGSSFYSITNFLLKNNIIPNSFKLKSTARLLNLQSKLKAGKYEINGGISSYALLKQLTEGRVAVESVRILEGITAKQIAGTLKRRIEVDSSRFMQLVHDPGFVKNLGVEAKTLEGFLFPDTYNFYWGMKSEDIISIMVNEFKKNFNDALRKKAEESGFSIVKALTLASIIEGEAVLDSERSTISAVYHNRLKRGVRLQADPTIQYVIEDGPRRLLKRDLEIDSPYNTYKYKGLPPGPINNPGLASIRASVHPENVNYLYFVANGDGSHTFSRTLKEHLRAKKKFDQYRRKINRLKAIEREIKKNENR